MLSFSCMIIEQVNNSVHVQLGSIRKLFPWPCETLNIIVLNSRWLLWYHMYEHYITSYRDASILPAELLEQLAMGKQRAKCWHIEQIRANYA